MGQFKPMVKMETTEPSVELKLKKGGKVVKKADGGMMGSPMSAAGAMPPSMPARGGMPGGMAPMKPSLAMRRRAMKGLPSGAGPAGPVGGAAAMQASMPPPPAPMAPAMKKGGKAEGGESKAMHKSEMKAIKGVKSELKSHAGKPASKGHKGLATGGVVDGQGGYKAGGIINTENQGGEYRNTKMHTAKADNSPAKTGGVKEGNGGGYATGGVAKANGGGYKKGGAPKKAYAAGGTVDSGRPVAMPQGDKKPSSPVSISKLSGTFKKGGSVTPAEGRLQKNFKSENATAMKQAKAFSNEVYSKYGKKMKEGGLTDLSKGAYDKSIGPDEDDMGMARSIRSFPGKVFSKVKNVAKDLFSSEPKADSVTKTKESVTVTPAKKRGGSVKC
jgi:hypothetical protein